jgi:hypothetical protein
VPSPAHRPRRQPLTPAACPRPLPPSRQVLEPKDGPVSYKAWDERSEIGQLELMSDDEQPLPANVMYPGTSQYWDKDQLEGQ